MNDDTELKKGIESMIKEVRMTNNFMFKILEKLESIDNSMKYIKERW